MPSSLRLVVDGPAAAHGEHKRPLKRFRCTEQRPYGRATQVYQVVWQSGETGMELPELKASLDRTMRLERTIKTQKLRAYLAALPNHFELEDYVAETSPTATILQRVRVVRWSSPQNVTPPSVGMYSRAVFTPLTAWTGNASPR